MEETTKITWLKRVLILKILAVLFIWGVPSLFGTAPMLSMFGVTLPEDPFYLRIFGAIMFAIALLYWFAYRAPVRNRDIIRYAVVDNGLVTIVVLVIAFTSGLSSWFFWVSAGLTAFFTITFAMLVPKDTL